MKKVSLLSQRITVGRASFNILLRIIWIKSFCGTHQKLKLVPMVLHATVEKLTTWITLLLLSQRYWYPFSPKVASSLIMGPQHYPRISRFRLMRCSLPFYHPGPSPCHLINRLLPSCRNHSRSVITSTSHRSNPSHATRNPTTWWVLSALSYPVSTTAWYPPYQ